MKMKLQEPRLTFLLKYYGIILLLFILSKPCFLLLQGEKNPVDILAVIWHGLPLDLATAAYVSAPLWLALAVSLWVEIPRFRLCCKIYSAIILAAVALALVANIRLYGFWGFPLDGTVLNYLDSPKGAAASVSASFMLGALRDFLVVWLLPLYVLFRVIPQKLPRISYRLPGSGAALVLGGLLFLAIRGGIGKSTANVGMVYYSNKQVLNHAAVNPVFSFISSAFKTRDFAAEHNYFSEEELPRQWQQLGYSTASVDSESLLTTQRPNVLLILMEGCGGTLVNAVDSLADARITPNLNRLAREGVFFSRCYANSFRTDRGTICALSGYPAFPDASVMKLPAKCATLPSIAASLKRAGYTTDFLYGGDINFTNTNGYLLSTGYERTFGDTSFSEEERHTHNWGVTDHITFRRLLQMIEEKPTDRPWHTGFLTLASHEPWGVPYSRIKNDTVANAFAYLDDCIGRFMAQFKKTRQWKNTLVIILPDHGIGYPAGIDDTNPRKSHIPMIWTGGAVRKARRIDCICNQTDLAATLLGQLGIRHDAFRFSRDVLSRTYTHPSAVHVWSEGIFYMDQTGFSAVNLLSKPQSVFTESPQASLSRQQAANALLQVAYDDLGGR